MDARKDGLIDGRIDELIDESMRGWTVDGGMNIWMKVTDE